MQAAQGSRSNGGNEQAQDQVPPFRPGRRRFRGSRVSIAVNLAPMIDVSFLLLIFFLVTTTFERAEGVLASKLPKDTGMPAVALPISPIVVRLSQVGPGENDYTINVDNFKNVPTGFVELGRYLRQIQNKPGFDAETPVVIVAGDDVRWDHVVGAWNAAVSAGCRNIAFGEQ